MGKKNPIYCHNHYIQGKLPLIMSIITPIMIKQ